MIIQRPSILQYSPTMPGLLENEQQKICYKHKVLNTSGLIAYLSKVW